MYGANFNYKKVSHINFIERCIIFLQLTRINLDLLTNSFFFLITMGHIHEFFEQVAKIIKFFWNDSMYLKIILISKSTYPNQHDHLDVDQFFLK